MQKAQLRCFFTEQETRAIFKNKKKKYRKFSLYRLLLKTIRLAATGHFWEKDSYADESALSIAKFITDRARPVDAAFNIT